MTLSDNVTNIGEWAFGQCTSLTGVLIPESVTTIGEFAFSHGPNLTAIDVAQPNPAYSSLEGVLFNKNQSVLIQYAGGRTGAYTVPHSVTNIGDFAFDDCRSLSSITIPDSVTTIGDGAFGLCTSLTSVTIPNSVTTIGPHAFDFCTSLVSVTIGNSLTKIGKAMFANCTNLTSITIPDSVTTIGERAFENCTSLASVYFRGNAPTKDGYLAVGFNNAIVYYLPGTSRWASTFAGRPTALWIPVVPSLPSFTAENPLRLETHSPAPTTVRVQRSVNLVDWEDWKTVSRDEGPSELEDLDASTTLFRFYRGVEE